MNVLTRRAIWVTSLFFLAITLHAQNVTVSACSGGLERCITEADSLYEMCFEIKPGPCAFTSFEFDWDDGTVEKINKPGPLLIKHVYDLRTFTKRCEAGGIKRFRFGITTNCPNNDNNGGYLIFKIKPRPQFLADVCEGRPATLQNNTCPSTTDVTWLWDFGDGSTATVASPSKTFSATATSYNVKLTATNSCGSVTTEQRVPVKKIPGAKYQFSGYSVNPVNVTDTVVCLSNGGTLTMDATISLDATSYSWQVSPSTYRFINGTSATSPKPQIQFSRSGTYIVTLTARNTCGTSQPMVCTHKVVDLPSPQLTSQPDTCQAFNYVVKAPIAGAVYTLNGSVFSPNLPQPLAVSSAPYIVAVTLNNTCGNQTVRDTFLVAPAAPVRITSPARPTILCVNGSPLLLTADGAGGTWSGTNNAEINRQGGRDFFNPRAPGRFKLMYQRGTGACAVMDTVTVEVQGIQPTVQSVNVCSGQATVTLEGSPAGGQWTTTDCVNCLAGNILTLTGLRATQLRVNYTVATSGGCSASATATVLIGQPNASFSVSSGCSSTAIKMVNTSIGSTSFQWLVNNNPVSTDREPSLQLPAGLVRITLISSAGSCSSTVTQEVTITAPPVNGSFTTSVSSGCSPLSVSFSMSGNAQPGVTYNWDFGNSITSTAFQPGQQTYVNQGRQPQSFTVTFGGSNACGSIPKTTQIITVLPRARAELGVDSTIVRCPPTTITFTNRSSGYTGNVTWDFGDNSPPVSSTAAVMRHTYLSPPTKQVYTVRLTVASDCGPDSDSTQITVFPSEITPGFTISKNPICPGDKVTFTDASTPVASLVKWEIDGHLLEGKTVSYDQFNRSETSYKIKMTAYPECGGFASREQFITTGPIPTGDFKVPVLNCVSQPVALTNTSDTRLRFQWNFGDGTSIDSTFYSPMHTYTTNGQTYLIKMTIVGFPIACTNVVTHPIEIRVGSQSAFSVANNGVVCSDTLVWLQDQSQHASEWKWYANDKLISTSQNPQIKLTQGHYDIKLWTSNNGTCADSLIKQNALLVDTCTVYVANVFTPNADNVSDRFNMYGHNLIKIHEMHIYDRWGVLVYEAANLQPNLQTEGWDGSYNGQRLPADNYVYEAQVEFIGGSIRHQRGIFTLLR
ncbi:PKD domain-containing protein [Spirosoma endophyticum]|uniref:Gliding motility-associated C-terminal domain-containing protein n=1 Tax=Spirosoma endophyticum TaxID=662367 RepID=A0A1I2GGZ3_9BACT|nr:PKD domain-containing protein [Spirosoma endophyticum]SFF16117.1 gliding motility-associated C-terminal domain-containing protein [Spirosoma endophyticum]